MRLLDTRQVRLQEFYGSSTPPYAILSHRWGDEEIVLGDILKLQGDWNAIGERRENASVTSKKGFAKLANAVELARRHDFQYIWVDTCCIDKGSSADLSEAINSMYSWYEKADVCYAFLFDVEAALTDDIYVETSSFQRSSWFKRGWTLQELIAPSEVEFFASDWSPLGNKRATRMFTNLLSDITGVPNGVLLGDTHPSETSIASRMQWASTRDTTRLEDIAYSLLGIFGVNMPLLYGEGRKAFIRLQEQILSQIDDDQTIFAWHTDESEDDALYGLLAESPSYFRNSGHFEPVSRLTLSEPWEMTSRGLKVDFSLHSGDGFSNIDYFVVLNCDYQDKGPRRSPVIYLKRIWVDEFARVATHKALYGQISSSLHEATVMETIYVKQKPSERRQRVRIKADGRKSIDIRRIDELATIWSVRDVHPRQCWKEPYIYLPLNGFCLNEALALFRIDVESGEVIDVAIGFQAVNQRQLRGWCVQLRANQENWQPEDNFWIVNELLRRGDISVLSSNSTEDVHGNRMRNSITVEVENDMSMRGDILLAISIHRSALPIADHEPQTVKLLTEKTPRNHFPGLEVVGSGVVPAAVREFQSRPTRPLYNRGINLDPVNGMGELTGAYITPSAPGSESNWSSCVQQGLKLHEIAKTSTIPRLDPKTLYSLCHTGLINKGILEASLETPTSTDPLLGFTLLHWAVLGAQVDTIKLLLEHQPRRILNLSVGGFSVFHVAAALGQWRIYNMLVEYIVGEDTKLSRSSNQTTRIRAMTHLSKSTHDSPLHLAAAFATNPEFWGNLSTRTRRYLIDDCKNPRNSWGATPLHVAALAGNLAATIALLPRRNDPHSSGRVDYEDDKGRTCVWFASFSNSREIIKRLSSRLALLNLADHNGIAPVHVACHLGHASVLTTLLQNGVSANTAGSDMCLLPSHVAAIYGRFECLQILLGRPEARFSWNREEDPDTPPYTAISLAVANGHLTCAQLLWDKFPVPFSGVMPCVVAHNGHALIEPHYLWINGDGFHSERITTNEPLYPKPRESCLQRSSFSNIEGKVLNSMNF